MAATPGAALLLVKRCRRQQGLEAGRSGPFPLAGRLRQRGCTPLVQCVGAHAKLLRHRFERCALRRQQPGRSLVLECLSVSCQLVLPSTPPGSKFYGRDNYSDAGGYVKAKYRGLTKNTANLVTLFVLSNLLMARK